MRQSEDPIHRERAEISTIERARKLGMHEDRARRNNTTVVMPYLTSLTIQPCDTRMRQRPAINMHLILDLDRLSG